MTSEPAQPKLLDRVREAIRVRHYSRRTEEAYAHWIRRYIVFHRKVHPATLGSDAIAAFLTWLAMDRRVSASTQNQALSAVLFLYRNVLGMPGSSRQGHRRGARTVCRATGTRFHGSTARHALRRDVQLAYPFPGRLCRTRENPAIRFLGTSPGRYPTAERKERRSAEWLPCS